MPDEHDLNELLGIRLQVRNQPHLLEHVARQILGFVDEEHDVLPCAPRFKEELVKAVDELLVGLTLRGNTQVFVDRAKKLGRAQRWIQDERA